MEKIEYYHKNSDVIAYQKIIYDSGYWYEKTYDEPNKYVQKCMSFENLSNQFKLFDEKEEKTFRNPLIFVKK